MTKAEEVKAKIENLIDLANEKTGITHTDLTSGVTTLLEGYGQGGLIEASTEAEMTSLLSTAEVGSVVKYVGESGTYENGALYIVEAVSE